MGSWKSKKPFRQRKPKDTNIITIKKGRAAALEVGDTVLVHVTAFRGQHKMQDRWENREYVVEKWPYPNLPGYVVCPRDGEGHSQALHRNYLLPISSNMEQDETDGSEDRVKKITPLWLQHHLWVVALRVVQISLLLLDVAFGPPGGNFPGDIKILGC